MKPDLKIVGEIKPPDYKDPVKMLRNLADSIEAGNYGDVSTIAFVTFGSGGLRVVSGGKESDAPTTNLLFQAACMKFSKSILGEESG